MSKWTREELDLLCSNFPEAEIADLCTLLPRHTDRAIYNKASYLGLLRSKAFLKRMRTARANRFVSRNHRRVAVLTRAFNRVAVLLREGHHGTALAVADDALEQLKEL